MMAKARYALYVVVLAIPMVHTVLAPYTKVEESFTLHAARDVLRHGVWGSNAIDQVGLEKWFDDDGISWLNHSGPVEK